MKVYFIVKVGLVILTTTLVLSTAFAEASNEQKKKQKKTQTNTVRVDSDESTALGINVIGGKDLPQVLYIVPWKSPEVVNKDQPESQILKTVFSPIDPEVFERSVRFRKRLQKESGKAD